MKRPILRTAAGIILLLFASWLALHAWIGRDVKENINIAMERYPGSAEDALISFLLDEGNSAYDRTHVAVWTLGRIQSKKALPILYDLYQNDPKGRTCYGKHDSLICQYEIHKALVAIESVRLFRYSRMKRMQ